LSKQKLLLSAAAAVLLAGPANADTTISTAVTRPLFTAHLSDTSDEDDDYTYGVGNLTITSAGSIKPNDDSVSAVTINGAQSVYSNGLIQNNKEDTVYGIEVDMSDFTTASTAWGASGATFTNASGETVSGALIYLDASSKIELAGSTGSTKYGIWINGTGSETTCAACVVTGDIVMVSGSDIYMKGTGIKGIYGEAYTTLVGNLSLSGTIELYQLTATSTSSTGLYGVYMLGTIDGNVDVASTGKILVAGQGAYAMFLSGGGISGALTIEGSVLAVGADSSLISSYDPDNSDTTYPEAQSALNIGASIDGGFMNSGTIKTVGTGYAVYISPSLSYGSSSYDTVESLVIGNYASTGYGIYNTGTITISPANTNKSATAAIVVVGGGSLYPTVIDGGIYNSGTISASVRNSTDSPTSVSATAMILNGYVDVGGYYDATTKKYTADSASCSAVSGALPTCGYTYTDSTGTYTVTDNSKASLYNTGTISSTSSGTGASATKGISISSTSQLTSIVNTGTILALSSVDADYVDDVTTLYAYAIIDYSGTLTYIYNTGTIAAEVTTLDDDTQVGYAVYLSGNTLSRSGDGVTIVNAATSSTSAVMIGNVVFGDGNNEQLYVNGYSSTYTSTLVGDISYGGSTSAGEDNGDLLYVGPYATVTGRVTATNGVAVEVYGYGTLTLENDTTSLTASDLTVYDSGTLTIGVSEEMEDTGAIDVQGTATIYSSATLGVSYNSFVPQGDNSYLLIRTATGNLLSGDGTALTTADLAEYNSTISTNMPFLFNSASLAVTQSSDDAYDEVVLNVTPKTSSELKLTGYASQMFKYINAALDIDPDLGAAMINDIGAGCGAISDGACTGDTTMAEAYAQTQTAYNAYAPNISGGTRAIVLSLTDQATGVVGARQRAIRRFDKDESGTKIWTQAFVQSIKTDGQGEVGSDGSYAKNGFKDKGLGFAMGVDSGAARFGWYGAALTMYSGNVEEQGRDSHENQLWVLLSGYSSWRGSHLFLDTKVDAGYGRIRGKRFITLTDTSDDTYTREAETKHAAESLSGGVTTGAIFDLGGFSFTPQISLDGFVLRTEKYSESNPDSTSAKKQAFLLTVNQTYARSLRGFVGTSVGYDFNLLGATWQPEARIGYRYDFMHDQLKAKVAFKDVNSDLDGSQQGDAFTLMGPDPARSNILAGGTMGVNGGSWSLNLGFDFVKGDRGLVEQIGTFNFVVRL
jgi:hypothetical protein